MMAEVNRMEPLARDAAGLLKALAHPARLMICCQLRTGEMAVGELERTLGIRQPNLSRELGRLREDGILGTRRESRVVFYRLVDARARSLIDAVCEVMLGRPLVEVAAREVGAARAAGGGAGGASRRGVAPAAPAAFGVFARTGRGANGDDHDDDA